MADLVMDVRSATAHRQGNRVVVEIQGELANSRGSAYADTSTQGDTADVYVRVKQPSGFGTEMTGPFDVKATIDDAASVKQVRVHARNGTKSISVQ